MVRTKDGMKNSLSGEEGAMQHGVLKEESCCRQGRTTDGECIYGKLRTDLVRNAIKNISANRKFFHIGRIYILVKERIVDIPGNVVLVIDQHFHYKIFQKTSI